MSFKHYVFLSLASSLMVLSSCGEQTVSKATPARLAALLDSGVDAERLAKIDERVKRAIDKNKTTPGLSANFDDDGVVYSSSSNPSVILASAMERNAQIGAAAQRINRADADRLNSIFGYLPQLSAVGTQAENKQNVKSSDNAVFQLGEAEYESSSATVELTQPIFDLSRIYAIQLATTSRAAAEIDYISVVQDVMFETFDTYVSAVQSKNKMRSLRQREALVRRQLSAENARGEAGLSQDSKTNAIQAELSNLGLELAQESLTYNTTLADLSFLAGRPVGDVGNVRTPRGVFGTERRISVAQAVAQASEQNPRLLRSLVSVAESDLRKRQAVAADFSPVMTAFANYVYEDRSASRFGGGSVTSDSVYGVRLVVPIFNAQGNGYSSLVARVDFRDAYNGYLAERRLIAADIQATHERLKAITQALSRARSAASSNQKIVDAEKALLSAGQSQDFMVASLEGQVAIARERASFYELEYLRAWARLEYLSGLNLAKRL